jgi:hypothetical protein
VNAPAHMLMGAFCAVAAMNLWALDPPAGSSSSPSATAPPSSTPAPTEPAAAAAATPATTASTSAPTTASSAKPNPVVLEDKTLTQEEVKQLLAQGYRPLNRDGQLYYCRRETELGSRFAKLHCRTGEQAKQRAEDGKDWLNKVQTPSGCRPNGPTC